MSNLSKLLTALCLVVCGAIEIPNAWAGPGFQPVSPDELKIASEPQAPGAPAIILYRQVDRDDNGRTSHEDNYFRIKILAEAGRKYANVEIPFLKQNEDVVNIRARTIKPDGSIVSFDGKVFEKTIVKAKGVKYLAKTFTLPDVQVGGIIEYFYTNDFSELYLFDSHWILSDELFTRRAQFSLKPYTLKPYESYFLNPFRLRWTFQRLPPGAEAKKGADGFVRMEASNIPAFPTEDFMPPTDELKARVDFIYEDDTSEREPEKYWRQVGKSRNNSLEGFLGKRKAMETAVAQIVSPSDAPEVKLRKIYDRVQAIRNTSYELQRTEQEQKRANEKPPDNVEEVWKRGYGDRHTLPRLFLALVRAAGFEAYECWISDRRHYFFVPLTMESRKLNSNVVLVKLTGKDLYLDPGDLFTPFGMLAWSETGTPGLRLDKDGGTWIRTALPSHSESRIERNAKLTVTDTGDLKGRVTVTYTGLEAMIRRIEERNADEVDRKKFLEDGLKDQIPAGAEVELVNKPDWGNAEAPLVAEFDLTIAGWASAAGKRSALAVGVFTAAEKRIFEHADRVHPIYFEYSFEKVDDISIEMPAGWHTSSLPNGRSQDGHIVMYTLKVDDNSGTLHLVRKLSVDAGLYDPKYYAGLRNFFQTVRSGDEEQIVLQPGTAAGSN
jgi:hypothetical protein